MSFAANLPLFCIVACLVCSVVSSVLNGKAARYLSMALCARVLHLLLPGTANGVAAG